ncbi:preprotein translocase subunit SecG [Marinomonas mediterranea]|jgi:protein translocase subunit secG|uniref:Protein-export membrane protein SecG n=1 Tax=Marinomonas mediterranea (strain ATCC 700492 / JCM 21426 / NBRC 103028 / MMB-1) TaxID=717774 RepID=F2K4F2_MARM1|nr:preprotein translocase subunit SecG [Marinomonas mediterranea]ADZ90251.1 preprotein translocase, SecG subunit [Marinomonas mediterranea MMB-1]WCN08312.1 preprotein translocase subunit SecG [Marinomonas mediterranea]WCN12370.1 preprotein translocase subunit SecG [Marinomonas mediterranea]WCN16443.1 preprotein translocase subunit SecG [Marinomonas mediterranea MMB-1]
MEALILVVHVLAAVAIIALVLLQQGKGADAGASFGGGASQTVFGSQGGSSFFGRMTAFFALVFFLTSFGLAYVASEKAKSVSGALDFVPQAPVVESEDSLPQLDTTEVGSDIPSN